MINKQRSLPIGCSNKACPTNRVSWLAYLALWLMLGTGLSGWAQAPISEQRFVVQRALANSHRLNIRQAEQAKTHTQRQKAHESYLPRISAQASYTLLNDDIRLPADLEQLLLTTQRMAVKEGLAMQLYPQNPQLASSIWAMPYPTQLNTANPADPANFLYQALQTNVQPIPPIQEQSILKASVQAEMLLFSGLKVPYSSLALRHAEQSQALLAQKEASAVVLEALSAYDRLAVLRQSKQALAASEHYLDQQERYVAKAIETGLATSIERNKIVLARQQLAARSIELSSATSLVNMHLQQLTGLSADSVAMLQPDLQPMAIASGQASVAGRADLQALDQAIVAASYQRRAQYAGYWPTVFAFGKKELLTDDLSTFDPEWALGLGLKWTLFDGLATHRSSQLARAEQHVLEQRKLEAQEQLNLNLHWAETEFEKNKQLYLVAAQQVSTAEETCELARRRYEAGLLPLTEYMALVQQLETARLDQIKALYQQRASAYHLLDATGQLQADRF